MSIPPRSRPADQDQAVTYSHTQHGRSHWLALAIGVVVSVLPLAFGNGRVALIMALSAALPAFLIAWAFSAMTVTVTDELVQIRFRAGWPHRTIKRIHVESHEPVRSPWWYGWGLRFIPGGTMWSVWGLDAVELKMVPDASDSFGFSPRPGKAFRIGTDDPEGLDRALRG
ncbi:MAG: hypothetical protein AAF480_07335 [Actinomycetota bacterium]